MKRKYKVVCKIEMHDLIGENDFLELYKFYGSKIKIDGKDYYINDIRKNCVSFIEFEASEHEIEIGESFLTPNKKQSVTRYHIYYRQYNIFANDYIPYIKIVETDDIYHEIGKMICTSLEEIENIRYTQPRASQEDCEKLWTEGGYEKITDTLWRISEAEYRKRKENENGNM